MDDGKYELVEFPGGTVSVRPVNLGGAQSEAMHSSIGPWEEANRIYAGLLARLSFDTRAPVVIWDVGMGIAANALAAIERHECGEGGRNGEMRVISFECDIGGLRLALENCSLFPFLARHREKVKTLLREGSWSCSCGVLSWKLLRGDFFSTMENAPSPDLIFYDFYSPAQAPELWGVGAFRKLRARCPKDRPTVLLTYVASTAARSALLLADFFVGKGCSTRVKRETTVGATDLSALRALAPPLGREWIEKLRISSKAYPPDLAEDEWQSAFEKILRNPQFR